MNANSYLAIRKINVKCEVSMNWKLYLDDIRHPSVSDYVIAKNVKEAKTLILQKGFPTHISFDHDLGLDENGVLLETGYDFAKWIVETDQSGEVIIPEDFTFTVHSANPIGAQNISGLLANYLEHKKHDASFNAYIVSIVSL